MGQVWKVLVRLLGLSLAYPSGTAPLGMNASKGLIGIYGPITSLSHKFLAGAVAFDLDLRKHFEPDLVQQFGPPLVEIPSLHPQLQEVGVVIGTSHSNPEVGGKTVLDWMLSSNTASPPMMAIVGGFHSLVATRVASLLATFEAPQVAWGATSPALSDKMHYPYFLRTMPPDTIQGQAMWVWMEHFSINSAAMLFAEEPYGEGLFKAVEEAAGAQSARVKAVGIPYMPDPESYNLEIAKRALQGVRESGSKFILMALVGAEANSALYLLEQDGLVGGAGMYQVLGAESVFPLDETALAPSHGSLIGLQKLYPLAAGPLWPRFEELWRKLTPADLYSEEARERYMLDSMRVRLESGRAPFLTAADLSVLSSDEPGLDMFAAFLFDAGYTVALAINALLNKGIALASVAANRTSLLEEMKATVFDGVTGSVSFNEQGDRDGQFHLWNLQTNASGGVTWAVVGLYDIASRGFSTFEDPVWSTGDRGAVVPSSLLECPPGFERESATNLCEKCRPGIGCGFRKEDGFPIGIFGPLTTIEPAVLALSAIFDLDFRKHSEPALQERFGPPIVQIPDLHRDLRIKTQIGTSHSEVSVGVETVLDWCTGAGDFYKVAGIVGGAFSAITRPAASTAAVYEVPQIGFAASSPSLSDKTLYPWFSRVNPPDSLQGQALWVWMEHFSVPSVAFAYTREPYGEGIFQTTKDLATIAGASGRIIGVGVMYQNTNSYVLDHDLVACETIERTGSKFIVTAFPSKFHITSFLYALETKDMLYGPQAYQLLGFEGLRIADGSPYMPSMGLPLGCQGVRQVAKGRLYPRVLEMWRNMTTEDIYGPEASKRYMLSHLKVLLSDATVPPLTDANFKEDEPFWFYLYIIDAAYTFVFAINSLLNEGIPAEDIHGSKLLDEVRNTTFEGISGMVNFNSLGDRHTDSELWNVRLVPGSQGQSERVTAALWKAGSSNFVVYEGASSNGSLTWARGLLGPTAPDELTACPAGKYWDVVARLCLACERNTYSTGDNGKATKCIACEPGWVSTSPSAATGCEKCPAGTFRINEEECELCPKGRYGASKGQSACTDCDVGNYSSSAGQTACEMCGAGFATKDLFKTMSSVEVDGIMEYFYLSAAEREEDCGCDRGTRRDGNNECIHCTEGMVCKGMNDVKVSKGYYAGPIVGGGLSIFKCYGESERCRGGLPGRTCARGRKGITCAECMDGMAPSSDGECADCGGGDHGAFVVIVLIGAVMLVVLYYVVDTQNRAKGSHALILSGTSIGMFMTMIQLLAVLGTLPLEYKEPLKGFMASFAFDLNLLRVNCVSAPAPLSRYVIKLVLILIVVAFLVAVHVLSVVFYYGRAGGWRLHSLTAGIGALFMVFYIAVTSTVLEPLQCQNHPNIRWTVLSYPAVLCWDGGDHQTMLILGIIAFLLIPLAYMVVCVIAVKQFPSRMSVGDTAFLKAFSFLFIRFRASQHTFVLKQMMRSFGVAMVLVIPNVVVQVFLLEVALLASYTASLALQPWRVEEANFLDCLQGAFSLLVVCLASLFLEEDQDDLEAMSWIALIFMNASIIFTFFGVGVGLFKKYLRRSKPFQFFLCHHKAGAGAYTRLLKMQVLEHPKVVADVFLDSDNLDNLDCLFDYVGNSTSTLVVVCSAEIFSRPWCLGEMCTARLHSVPLCRISLPSSRLPDQEFINQLANELEGVEALAENGIDLEMVQTTLYWISDTPIFSVPDCVHSDTMAATAEKLVSKDWTDVQTQGEFVAGTSSCSLQKQKSICSLQKQKSMRCGHTQCPMFYDRSNIEAEATASILKKLLIPLMVHRSAMVPEPWRAIDSPDNPIAIVVLCSNGILSNEDALQLFNRPCPLALFPVLGESGFRFPGKDFASELQKQHSSMDPDDIAAIAAFVHCLFKEIAVTFVAQQVGEAELKLAARQASVRLLHAGGSKGVRSATASTIVSMTSSQGVKDIVPSRAMPSTFVRGVSSSSTQEGSDAQFHATQFESARSLENEVVDSDCACAMIQV